jgi:hypothetical protein
VAEGGGMGDTGDNNSEHDTEGDLPFKSCFDLFSHFLTNIFISSNPFLQSLLHWLAIVQW